MYVKERIIEETTKMFVAEGVRSIRMDDIATSMCISKRTIYELFGDKETLITECLKHYHYTQSILQRELTAGAKNVIEEFIIMLSVWDEHAEQNYKMMQGVRKFYPKIHEAMTSESYESSRVNLKQKLEEGISQGLFLANVNLDLAIAVFRYSVFGIVSEDEALLPHNVSSSEAFKYIITYFFRGIATEKGIKILDEYIIKN